MPETLIEFAGREYDYLRSQEGRDLFLALAPYLNALLGKRRVKRVIRRIEREMRESLERYVKEQTGFVAEATRIRRELAERAPEIDNSDMQRPDAASHERARYDLDSFARFDELTDADTEIAYPTLPSGQYDPGPMGDLFVILRGRLRAAEYGEDASGNDPQVRDDLGARATDWPSGGVATTSMWTRAQSPQLSDRGALGAHVVRAARTARLRERQELRRTHLRM